jgi:hypothetical protein
MSQDAHDEKTRKKRRLKTRRFAEEEEEDEKSLAVHPSGIQMLQKLRAKKSKVCVSSLCFFLSSHTIMTILSMVLG